MLQVKDWVMHLRILVAVGVIVLALGEPLMAEPVATDKAPALAKPPEAGPVDTLEVPALGKPAKTGPVDTLRVLAQDKPKMAEPADTLDVFAPYLHAPADLCSLGAVGLFLDDRVHLSFTAAHKGFLYTMSLGWNGTRLEVPKRDITTRVARDIHGDRQTRTAYVAAGFAFGPHFRLTPRARLTTEANVVFGLGERRFIGGHSEDDQRGRAYYTKDGREFVPNIGVMVGVILLMQIGDGNPADGEPRWRALLLGVGTSYRRIVTFKMQYGLGG
jgi:hypothetical protein